jgi:hypothetical protein
MECARQVRTKPLATIPSSCGTPSIQSILLLAPDIHDRVAATGQHLARCCEVALQNVGEGARCLLIEEEASSDCGDG